MSKVSVMPNIFGSSSHKPAKLLSRKAAAQPAAWQAWVSGVFVVAAVLLLGSYLISVNSFATTGYQIKQMQVKLSDLTTQNQKLTVKVAELSSMVSVQSQVLGADFVPAGTPQFLQVNEMTMR